jgi:hypothetical protein
MSFAKITDFHMLFCEFSFNERYRALEQLSDEDMRVWFKNKIEIPSRFDCEKKKTFYKTDEEFI